MPYYLHHVIVSCEDVHIVGLYSLRPQTVTRVVCCLNISVFFQTHVSIIEEANSSECFDLLNVIDKKNVNTNLSHLNSLDQKTLNKVLVHNNMPVILRSPNGQILWDNFCMAISISSPQL